MAENAKEQLVLVAPAESPEGRPRFYGYHVAHRGGEVVVLGAGMYEVVPLEGGKQQATLVKDVSALNDEELAELARNTPQELLPHLDKSGMQKVVDTHIYDLLKRDPLAVAKLPRSIMTKKRIEDILAFAQMELSPLMFKILLAELLGSASQEKGYDAGVVSIVFAREQDEKREDELLQKPAEEARKMEEERRRREEERKRERRQAPFATINSWILLSGVMAIGNAIDRAVAGSQKSRAQQVAVAA